MGKVNHLGFLVTFSVVLGEISFEEQAKKCLAEEGEIKCKILPTRFLLHLLRKWFMEMFISFIQQSSYSECEEWF